MSFQRYGISGIPAGAAFLSADKAYLLLNEALVIVVFDPTETMILDEIDISSLARPDLTLETWFVTPYEDRLYVPVRRGNGAVPVDGELYFGVSPDSATTTVYRIDPLTNSASSAFEITGVLREIYRLK